MNPEDDYCRNKAAPEGSNLHYATLFESAKLRLQLLPVFALHYEISECLTASTDPGVTRVKLEWWSEELSRLSAQQPRHPVTTRLLQVLDEPQIDSTCLVEYLHTIVSIAARPSSPGVIDWFETLTRGLGQIWTPATRLSGLVNSPIDTVLRINGGTIFLLELLQNLHPLSARGYRFLPDELLEQYGTSASDLLTDTDKSAASGICKVLIEMVEDRLVSCYTGLLKEKQTIPSYPLIMNRLALNVCSEIRQDGYQLLHHKIALTPIRKLWIATRTRYYK